MPSNRIILLAGVSLVAATPAFAQDVSEDGQHQREREEVASIADVDIIVNARRKDERLQDVPVTINAITSEDLQRLNLRSFQDVTAVIPGFQIVPGGATVRGVAFAIGASGSNPTIGFYQNDAPVPATDLFTTMFDVGQIELLRGPQGTLRGRASPSGALTVTTRRPSLIEAGGYVNMTATHRGGINANAAIGLPIIENILAVRVAGLIDQNSNTTIKSVNSGTEPFTNTRSIRGTVLFQPIDDIRLTFTAQNYRVNQRSYIQVESIAPVAGLPYIVPRDRLATEDSYESSETENTNYNLQAQWTFAGQALYYVGQRTINTNPTYLLTDYGDVFGPGTPSALQGYGNYTTTRVKTWSHEVRLQSETRVLGIFDYVLGAYYNKLESASFVLNATPTWVPPSPTAALSVSTSLRLNAAKETSFFGNLTAHLDDHTEIAGGLRHIHYEVDAGLCNYSSTTLQAPVRGLVPTSATCTLSAGFEQHDRYNSWIYTGSIKHDFSDDLMVYASIGSSWRPGIFAGGFPSGPITTLQRSFLILPPEESTSYEIGLKSSFLDRRMRVNLSGYYQKFSNYPFRPSSPLSFVAGTTSRLVSQSVFVAAVPAKVWGGEFEWTFAPNRNWDMGVNVAYAKSKISNGTVPCNDYVAPFGVADPAGTTYTTAQIIAATGGQNVGSCQVSISAAISPEWSGNAQSEYRFPISDAINGFVRGLATFYGKNGNDQLNTIDDVSAYAIVNLYAGVRDSRGAWELTVYAKNVLNTLRVLRRDPSALAATYVSGASAVTLNSSYRRIAVNDPREFGLNLRYSFGSH